MRARIQCFHSFHLPWFCQPRAQPAHTGEKTLKIEMGGGVDGLCICITLKRATEMEKEKREQGRSCVAVLPLWGVKKYSLITSRPWNKDTSPFRWLTVRAAHTGVQIGPHWQGKLQLTASSNYNNGPSSEREREGGVLYTLCISVCIWSVALHSWEWCCGYSSSIISGSLPRHSSLNGKKSGSLGWLGRSHTGRPPRSLGFLFCVNVSLLVWF